MISDPHISISKLSKSYREAGRARAVLKELDLQTKQGEFLALLGSSGCGKSTFLNLLAGIDQADSGSIRIGDSSLETMTEQQRTFWRRRYVGFVFQFFNLIPTLNVLENVCLPLQLNNVDATAQQQRAQQLLTHVGLAGREQSLPEQLSGGEQQRLAVVRALIHRPTLLLADEPTGNLDQTTGQTVLKLLRELSQDSDTTVIMVTHSRAAADYANRVCTLQSGRLVEAS